MNMIREGGENTIIEDDLSIGYRRIEDLPQQRENPNRNDNNEYTFKSTKRRWLVLFAMFSLSFFIGLTEILAPILEIIQDLLSLTDLKIYSWILNGCSYLPLATIMPTAWIVDKRGLKFGIYAGVLVLALRNGFRALFFLPDLPLWSSLRYLYFVLSTILNVQVITLFFCLPLKVSETWFKEEERFTAWAIIIIGFEVGSAVSAYLIPLYITSRHNTYLLAYSNIAAALALFLIVLVCIRDSKPPTPPSDRVIKSSQSTVSYLDGIKIMLTNRDFIVHLLFLTFTDTFAIAIGPILQDILKAAQYDSAFCGQLLSIVSISGAVFLFISSYSVLLIKTSTIGCKILACFFTISIILYFQVILLPDQKWLILGASLITSFFGSVIRPCFQNMSVHLCSGFVREATISGFAVTLVIFINSIFSLTVVYMRRKISEDKYSYRDSMMFLSISSLVVLFFYLLLFRGKQPENEQSTQGNNL